MIDFENKSFLKLKHDEDYAEKVADILLDDEQVAGSYKSVRDGVVFTDKRIIAVNVQGLTGKKKDFSSLPYSKVVAFSVETGGTFDLDAELELWFSSVGRVRFEFSGRTDVKSIARLIAAHAL